MPVKMESFFTGWLKAHGEKDIVTDDRGVGLLGNATRLWATTYAVKPKPGQGCSVELEFRVSLLSGREIVEYVAGLGEDEAHATQQSMENFVRSTFHVIYKSFLNKDDPHQSVEDLTLDGKKRALFRGSVYLLGNGELEASATEAISNRLKEFPSHLQLNSEVHWVKLVYAQHQGKALTVAVTVDNQESAELTRLVAGMSWPASDNFYMVKQFMIIR